MALLEDEATNEENSRIFDFNNDLDTLRTSEYNVRSESSFNAPRQMMLDWKDDTSKKQQRGREELRKTLGHAKLSGRTDGFKDCATLIRLSYTIDIPVDNALDDEDFLPRWHKFYSDHLPTSQRHDRGNHRAEDDEDVLFSFKNALCPAVLRTTLHVIWISYHIVLLALLTTQVTCSGIQDVPLHCKNGLSIASENYDYETINRFINAPRGERILLTFNDFSLGSDKDELVISDILEKSETQAYKGNEKSFSPFLSRRNILLLRFSSFSPVGRGFNISASCHERSETRAGRLVGGNTPSEGLLELHVPTQTGTGEWMRVCENNLSRRLAEVVCGELGYATVHEVSYEDGGCQDRDTACIRAPKCGNYAYRLQDCSTSSMNCTSPKAVKIKCFGPGFIGCYNFTNTEIQGGSTNIFTPECVSSCRSIDTVEALAIVNATHCFCITTHDINLSALTIEGTCTHSVYNASVGFCNQADDVMNGSWNSNITWFGSIVHLTCDEGYRVDGSRTLQCLPGVSPFLPVWNNTMPTCERHKVTHIDDHSGFSNAVMIAVSTLSTVAVSFALIGIF